MTLKTYLFRCKRNNSIWLFWIFINSLCVYLNGILSAKAISTIVNFDLQSLFVFKIGAILAVNLLLGIAIYQTQASEKLYKKCVLKIRKDIVKRIEKDSGIYTLLPILAPIPHG